MWLENLRDAKTASKKTTKQISEESGVAERTITRILSGETDNPSVANLRSIVNAIGVSLDDIFEDTKAVIGRTNLAELEAEVERLTSELDLANAENAVLQDKAAALTAENDILRLKLEHKDELLALHNYYIKMKASE